MSHGVVAVLPHVATRHNTIAAVSGQTNIKTDAGRAGVCSFSSRWCAAITTNLPRLPKRTAWLCAQAVLPLVVAFVGKKTMVLPSWVLRMWLVIFVIVCFCHFLCGCLPRCAQLPVQIWCLTLRNPIASRGSSCERQLATVPHTVCQQAEHGLCCHLARKVLLCSIYGCQMRAGINA